MESSFRFRPCSHHHHHHHLCHHHHHHHHNHHHHHPCCRHHHSNHHFLCPRIAPHPLQYSHSNYYSVSQIDLNSQPNSYKQTPASISQVAEEQKQSELDNEDEEDDDPIFVLTDEWREFFAKSEAKRKLEKQGKKNDRQP